VAGGVLVVYPILPWIGVMALGFGVAPWLVGDQRNERRIVLAGVAMIAAFVLLRLTNLYGNPVPWEADGRGALWSTLAALNVQKYPPSLLFLLMTLGPALILFVVFEHLRGAWLKPVTVFGRVPLFYYLIHTPLIVLSAAIWAQLSFGQIVNGFAGPAAFPRAMRPTCRAVYLVWGGAVARALPAVRLVRPLQARASAEALVALSLTRA
jgi:uncharacterized membrane protein